MRAKEFLEGASMVAYHKHPKDDKLWTFPDGYTDDEEVETPYMSNASMRNFLDELGYDPNFEDAGPVPAKELLHEQHNGCKSISANHHRKCQQQLIDQVAVQQ